MYKRQDILCAPINALYYIFQDLKSWVQGAKDGVIYFSLGSNMQGTSLPEEKRNAFLDAFARFPNYHIIWKWETDMHFPGQAENIKFKKWIPQQDLLGNVHSLFINMYMHTEVEFGTHEMCVFGVYTCLLYTSRCV